MDKNRHLAKPDYVVRREAREAARAAARRKSHTAITAMALTVVLAAGGTVAWLTAKTTDVTNTFTPASVPVSVVEEFDGEVKEDVRIQNEGNIRAFIRAYVTVNWVDADGNIVASVPDGYSYAPANPFEKANANGWAPGSDGFYYYLTPVEPDDDDASTTSDMTAALIESITQSKAGEDYSLQVDIVAQSIQVDGVDGNGNKPIELAWGVDIENGELKPATIAEA